MTTHADETSHAHVTGRADAPVNPAGLPTAYEHGGRLTPEGTTVDPILVEIVQGTLASVEMEVETAIARTSRSPRSPTAAGLLSSRRGPLHSPPRSATPTSSWSSRA